MMLCGKPWKINGFPAGDILSEKEHGWEFVTRSKRAVKLMGETIPPQFIEGSLQF